MNNKCTGQLIGPFEKNVEIMEKIEQDAAVQIKYVSHLGIKAEPGTIVKINEKEYEIGLTGTLEWNNCDVISIIFVENTNNDSSILYEIKI